jgi:hypothetical protein
MEREAITKLISRENEDKQHEMEHRAREIIRSIGAHQARKASIDAEIGELRDELKKLNTEMIEPAQVLGDE